ncbi:MAG: sigma-70 family RNA polymerase sigma factor [Spirochaetales bacterium]|nr:sigma-70 family RNA polymerase sigma factor [Spirochaetales bacterium]
MNDNRQFIEIYDEYAEPIYRYIHYKTCQRETAEDLTSQTFLKAMEKWHQFNSARGSLSSWLYGIARNLVTDHYRSRGRWGFISDISDIWDMPASDNVIGEIIGKEEKQELHRALGTLPSRHREIVILRVWEDLPYRDIAAITGKSEANCKMLFSRALKKLKSRLGPVVLCELILARPFFERREL